MADGGEITITTRRDDGADDRVILRVRDTGCGMDAETRARIFDPFFTTKGEKGSGIGLPVVRKIVEEAGGSIEVTSEPGVGTTFTVRLPAAAR